MRWAKGAGTATGTAGEAPRTSSRGTSAKRATGDQQPLHRDHAMADAPVDAEAALQQGFAADAPAEIDDSGHDPNQRQQSQRDAIGLKVPRIEHDVTHARDPFQEIGRHGGSLAGMIQPACFIQTVAAARAAKANAAWWAANNPTERFRRARTSHTAASQGKQQASHRLPALRPKTSGGNTSDRREQGGVGQRIADGPPRGIFRRSEAGRGTTRPRGPTWHGPRGLSSSWGRCNRRTGNS